MTGKQINLIGRILIVGKIVVGALLVHHGWSGEPANFFPFLFGLWVLLDVRLSVISLVAMKR